MRQRAARRTPAVSRGPPFHQDRSENRIHRQDDPDDGGNRHHGGECGERQVEGADVGLTHNVGGIGQYCFVNLFRRD